MRHVFNSAFSYGGGKASTALAIIDELPSATMLVDVFTGGCSQALAALRSCKYKQVVANDINPRVWRTLVAIANKPNEVAERIKSLPQGRPTYERCATELDHEDDVIAAAAVIIVCRFSTSCLPKDKDGYWKASIRSKSNPCHAYSSWRNLWKKIGAVHGDLLKIYYENLDWNDCIKRYSQLPDCAKRDGGNMVFLLDPPYKSTSDHYGIQFNHPEFIKYCNDKGEELMMAILDRANEDMGLNSWTSVKMPACCGAGNRSDKDRERWRDNLWLSPACQRELEKQGDNDQKSLL